MAKYFGNDFVSLNHFNHSLFKLNISLFILLFACSSNNDDQTLTTEKIYKNVSDAVVVIYAYNSNNELSGQGSGVVINDNGYVVTNYHVLAGNDRLEILHNEEIVPYVDIIGIDVEKDILILKIEDKKFPSIKIGDSETLTIGQQIFAIGSPLGFENSISEGIISGLRSNDVTGKKLIQITASISPGSSGGAVINDKGELIGISTFTIKEGQNLNFAIPINDVLSVDINSYSKNNAYKNFEWLSKGNDENDKGNYKEAIKYYTIYIKENPNDDNVYNNRGNAKKYLQDYRGAIQDYTKAIEINPNLVAYSNRGIAKSDLGDYRGAIQDFNKAIETIPNFGIVYVAYYYRALIKSKLQDYRGAIQDYTKAIEINPNYIDAYIDRGNTKSKLQDYTGAIQDYTKTIEINPKFAKGYYNRASEKWGLEDYRGAIQDLNKAIDINPKYAEAYYNRGMAKYDLGDKYGACLDWSKAGELGIIDAYNAIREVCN